MECPVISGLFGVGIGALIVMLWARYKVSARAELVLYWQHKAIYWERRASSKMRDEVETIEDLQPP